MTILKSIFISTYIMVAMAITAIAAWSLWNGGDFMSWAGVILVTAPFLMLISWLMMFRSVARTSARFPLLNALAAIGVILASWGHFQAVGWGYFQGPLINAPILSLVGWLGFTVYVYWYSSLGRRRSRVLTVGQALPQFDVKDVTGKSISSESLLDKPAIWIFYRGNWCPLCMAQIKELIGQYKTLQASVSH